MMRMVWCEKEEEYEQIWRDYNKALSDEPFLRKRFAVQEDFNYSMTPELMEVIQKKDKIVHEMKQETGSNEKGSSEKENKEGKNNQGCCLGKCFK